jgi:carboxyl-terminal processing protease
MIKLVLQRKVQNDPNPKLVEIELRREPITVDEERVDVTSEPFANGIVGTIKLHAFYQGANGVTSENDVRNAIKELSAKGPLKGLILDLRENSGGFLTQAVKVAALFIKSGVIVISKYSDGHEQFYRDMNGVATYTGPLIVLNSKATASAAEIVAQALQDYGVALVVGDEHTYGKGSIQSQTVTDNQATSLFKVTVGKYYTVSGKTPQIRGVQADILAPGPYDYEHIGEQYLENALSNDTIKPEYKDDLSDVDPGLKSWYLRYYLPTLQPKVTAWRRLLPTLQKESAARTSHNQGYQEMIARWKLEERDPNAALTATEQQKTPKDFQLAEAQNILKDMVVLHARERQAFDDQSSSQPFSGP